MAFSLHEKLAADCVTLGDSALCTVLLMRDDRFPWIILVPRVGGLRDLHDLPGDRVPTLFEEISAVSRALIGEFGAEKINVAALGNQVPQLHIHVIGRFTHDVAWPGPVWNAGAASHADAATIRERAAALRRALDLPHG